MARTQCRNYPIIEQHNQVKPAFGGAKLRIKPYWSELTLKYTINYANTFPQINTAADILRAHTLDLDWTNTINLIPFHEEIAFDTDHDPSDDFTNLRDLIPKDLGNRLVVIFTPIADVNGICLMRPDWLPFVIVDPRTMNPTTLMHEIGHACRCAHVAGSIMEDCGAFSGQRNFHNIHAWELYKSYWCTGSRRPDMWWDGNTYNLQAPKFGPYLWPPYDRQS